MTDPDVHRLTIGEREIVLVGTAHISKESADLARRVIEEEQPDTLCLELDTARYEQLSQGEKFEQLDVKEIIRRQQLMPLLLNLVLVSYQRQLGGKLGVSPGTEFIVAADAAHELGIPLSLCDRDIRVTLRRAWGAISFWKKFLLLSSVMGAAFEDQEISEADLQHMREQDVVTRLIEELGAAFPGLAQVLIYERDTYLAEKIRRSDGRRIVAVIGAGHVSGVRRILESQVGADLTPMETIPPGSWIWTFLGWSMPAMILGAMLWIGWQRGAAAAGGQAISWILITGVPSMVGTILAAGHPLTILSALLAAPITTLTPLLGVGYITAFVEAYLRPPRVYELRSAAQDVGVFSKWWSNRLLRLFLVFILSSIGGSAGMFAGSTRLIRELF